MTTPTTPEIPTYLSRLPQKRLLYAVDTYFRESFEDLTRVAGLSTERFCHDHALLLLKPDAVVTRRLGAVLRWVIASGFTIVCADVVTIDRHGIRALWQYGLNAASRDRRDAADLYVTASDCLLLILALPGRPRAATLVLSEAKGPADPVRCRPGQLRHDVGSFNYQLNLVHTADEPADLLRELAVLCDHETRLTLYRRTLAGRDHTAEAFALVRRLEAATPAVDLRIERTLDDLASAATGIAAQPRVRSNRRSAVPVPGTARADRPHTRRRVPRLAPVGPAGRGCGVPVSRWQRIVLATHLLDPYLPGATSLLPGLLQHRRPEAGRQASRPRHLRSTRGPRQAARGERAGREVRPIGPLSGGEHLAQDVLQDAAVAVVVGLAGGVDPDAPRRTRRPVSVATCDRARDAAVVERGRPR